jgi:hypothetical protein
MFDIEVWKPSKDTAVNNIKSWEAGREKEPKD